VRKFQDLRAINMTTHEGAQAAIPHQGYKNPSCQAWFSSPRRKAITNRVRRAKERIRRNRHGTARAIENLRGVRIFGVEPRQSGVSTARGVKQT
jgi:hypothetical protein